MGQGPHRKLRWPIPNPSQMENRATEVDAARQAEWPKQSYQRPPEQASSPSDYVFKPNQMLSFYDVPGEFGHAIEGTQYGFESLSFIITEPILEAGHPCMCTTAKKRTCCWKVRPVISSAITSSVSKVRASLSCLRVFHIRSLIREPSLSG
jgi:hypothetical protein